MGTRSDWSSYKLQDGLNIWGAPNFQGLPVMAGGITIGDEAIDAILLKSRRATMTAAGDYIDIDSAYTYGEWAEARIDVTDWTGTGNQFQMYYDRVRASVANASGTLRLFEHAIRAEDGANLFLLQGGIINTMVKGTTTVTWLRGLEIKAEADAGVTLTRNRILSIENALLCTTAPATDNIGIWFEIDSAAASALANYHEIRMGAGMHILSGSGVPAMTAPKGSLYLRTDGTGAADRAYINTDGATTWTAISTAA